MLKGNFLDITIAIIKVSFITEMDFLTPAAGREYTL